MRAKFIYENLKGGKGDKITSGDVCPKQLAIGKKVEREHTYSSKKAEEIALDHLSENDKYYTELVEKGFVDEPDAIKEYIKHFGKKKLPKSLKLQESTAKDILKPKELVGKMFYAESRFFSYPVFVFKIIGIKSSSEKKLDSNYNLRIINNFNCEVIFNNKSIEGPNYYDLSSGETFYIDEESFIYFKEFDKWNTEKIDEKLYDLNEKKEYFINLKNES